MNDAPVTGAMAKVSYLDKLGESKPMPTSDPYEAVSGQLMEWVDAVYEEWKKDPENWQIIDFDHARERDEAVKAGRWASKNRPAGALTMQVRGDEDPTVLVYRFRDPIERKRKPRDAQAAENTAGDDSSPDQGTADQKLAKGKNG